MRSEFPTAPVSPTDGVELAEIDRSLGRLAGELREVRGEYAAEAAVLEQIDVLLDCRLRLGR